jgi:hypothetical protein
VKKSPKKSIWTGVKSVRSPYSQRSETISWRSSCDENAKVGLEVFEGSSGRVGGVRSSASWMEGRWVLPILVGPVLEHERVAHRGEMRLALWKRHVPRVYIPAV